jgi:hypothetical protein
MKTKKIIPFAFLGLLLLIVIFIVGVKYGRKVAEVDKTIKYLISITPTKAVTPSPLPSITYESYLNEDCGIEFLYPSNLSLVKESSTGGQFKNSTDSLQYSCDFTSAMIKNTSKTATAAVTIQDKEITASKSGDIYIFGIQNKKRQTIQFAVSSRLKALIEKTLKVTK